MMRGGSKSVMKWTNSVTALQVEQLIGAERDLRKAVAVFDAASAEYPNGFRHDHTTFRLMISRFVSANQFRSAEALLFRMREEKCEIKEDLVLCLCRGYGRVHRPLEAMRIFRKMEEGFLCKPTSKSYISVLSLLVEENMITPAFNFYKHMKEMGIPPHLTSLNILLKALCKNSLSLDSALNMFRQMPSRGFTPDSYTYGTLISGLCRFRRITEAKKLFNEMEPNKCLPSVVTYSTLIHGLCVNGHVTQAARLFREMRKKGIPPNVFTYSSLLDGLCKAGKCPEALKLHEEMVQRRCRANMVTYSSLVDGLCRDNRLGDAVEIMDRMKLQGLRPDAGLYGKVITGLCNERRYKEAANFVDEMAAEGVSPNRLTWSIHVAVHNAVVQGLVSGAAEKERGYRVYLSARSRGITIERETFKVLVERYCREGRHLKKAARVVDDMVVDGCVPDCDTWHSLVTAFLGRHQSLSHNLIVL